MAEATVNSTKRRMRVRHRGRGSQILIYLGKQFRFFIYQSDWKVLPMAVVIAALVSMVIRRDFFVTMEGSLKGAFALTCVSIWNGCFNSIQSVCRERAIIKREHRSGMHISSYVAAHMIYQLFLCLTQTALSLFVMQTAGVKFPAEGIITPFMMVDVGITMLLVSYASDMMSLLISSVSHTTTGAMTVMPFVLIFQLVFSGGVIPLPEWSKPLSNFTISNYGIKAIASQSGYNESPMVTAWNTLAKMKNNEIGGTFTVGEVLDLLDKPAIQAHKDTVVIPSITVGEAAAMAEGAESSLHLRDRQVTDGITVGEALTTIKESDSFEKLRSVTLIPSILGQEAVTVDTIITGLLEDGGDAELMASTLIPAMTLGDVLDAADVDKLTAEHANQVLNEPVTLGQLIEMLKTNEAVQARRDKSFTVKTTVGELMNLYGEEELKQLVQEKTAAATYNADYERSTENILDNWLMLVGFMLLFALLATISLELIDHDKR